MFLLTHVFLKFLKFCCGKRLFDCIRLSVSNWSKISLCKGRLNISKQITLLLVIYVGDVKCSPDEHNLEENVLLILSK